MTIFCSGIGGIGLSAYAALQKAEGHRVMGSDRAESPLIRDLRSQGIDVTLAQDGTAIPSDCSLFVYSEAIPFSSPERLKAEEMGIPQMSYFQALGELSRGHTVIAVAGTHGKSSTTAMVAKVLIDAGLDPTVVVGTKLKELAGRNWRKGGSKLFVLEACEYRKSFCFLHPSIALLTNCDGDHFDAYKSVEEYQQAFVEFLKRLPTDGPVYTHMSDPDCKDVAERSGHPIHDVDGIALPALGVPGLHMQQNAQLAFALAAALGVPEAKARDSLASYQGAWRRMEVKGAIEPGVLVIDDYGHHPREITATLAALKQAYAGRRLVVVFQPHTHERTLTFYDDFTKAFADADVVLVTDVYEARKDIEHKHVDIAAFTAAIAKGSDVECRFVGSLDSAEEELAGELQANDVLLTLGAGTITELATRLVEGAS